MFLLQRINYLIRYFKKPIQSKNSKRKDGCYDFGQVIESDKGIYVCTILFSVCNFKNLDFIVVNLIFRYYSH